MKYYCLLFVCLIMASCAPDPYAVQTITQPSLDKEALAASKNHHFSGFSADHFPSEHLSLLTQDNFDFNTAILRLESAYFEVKKFYAQFLPQISLTGSASRISNNFGNNVVEFNNHSLGANIAWDIDPFGRLGALKNAALLNYDARYYDLKSLYLTLYHQYVGLYNGLVFVQKSANLAKQNEKIARNMAHISKLRHEVGKLTGSELLRSQQNLAEAKRAFLASEQNITTAKAAYQFILGKNDLTFYPEHFAKLPTDNSLDDGLVRGIIKASILDNRPDVIAARKRFEAAGQNIKATIAGLYPSLSLSLSVQNIASHLKDVFTKENLLLNMSANLAQLLFDGGNLQANIKISKIEAEILRLDYMKALTKAVNDLQRDYRLFDQSQNVKIAAHENLMAAQNNMVISKNAYRSGRLSLLAFMDIQLAHLNAQQRSLEAQKQTFDQYANLLLSMGQNTIEFTEKFNEKP